MHFVDTHCHIQFPDYPIDPDTAIKNAQGAQVTRLMCVGCTLDDSKKAVEFVAKRPNTWATIGLHPHEAKHYAGNHRAQADFSELATMPKVVAIGECGLDYYYNHSPKEDQIDILRFQIELAKKHDLPLVFHVRDAFDDFFGIYDEYTGLRGVVHSFSADIPVLDNILDRGLYIGLNGIMTFTKQTEQLEAARKIPLDRIVLETDAPFLTPTPYRGTICEPKHVSVTAEFVSNLRGESLKEFARATTQNAVMLFNLQ